jgi:hypothetical protein
LHCGSNNNPIVGQFVDALKSSIISGLAFRGQSNLNCEDDKTELLDNYGYNEIINKIIGIMECMSEKK